MRSGEWGMGSRGKVVALTPLPTPHSPLPSLLLLGYLRVVDYDFDAAVHLAPGGSVVAGDRFAFAEAANGSDALGLDARRGQIIAYRLGATLRKSVVQLVRADRVGVAFDFERQLAGIGEQDAGQFAQLLSRGYFERGSAGVEEHVAEIDDESASFAFRVGNLGEGDVEFLQRGVAFALGRFGGLSCAFSFGARAFGFEKGGLFALLGGELCAFGFAGGLFAPGALFGGGAVSLPGIGLGDLGSGLGQFGLGANARGLEFGAFGIGLGRFGLRAGLFEPAYSLLALVLDAGLRIALDGQIARDLRQSHHVTREAAEFRLDFQVVRPDLFERQQLLFGLPEFFAGELFRAGAAGDVDRAPRAQHQSRSGVIGLQDGVFLRLVEIALIGAVFGLGGLDSVGRVFRQRRFGDHFPRRHLDVAVRFGADDHAEGLRRTLRLNFGGVTAGQLHQVLGLAFGRDRPDDECRVERPECLRAVQVLDLELDASVVLFVLDFDFTEHARGQRSPGQIDRRLLVLGVADSQRRAFDVWQVFFVARLRECNRRECEGQYRTGDHQSRSSHLFSSVRELRIRVSTASSSERVSIGRLAR